MMNRSGGGRDPSSTQPSDVQARYPQGDIPRDAIIHSNDWDESNPNQRVGDQTVDRRNFELDARPTNFVAIGNELD